MPVTVHAFPDDEAPALALARCLGAGFEQIALHCFPDGESLVRVQATTSRAIIYRSLNQPNQKIFEIILAAGALRDRGAEQVLLVAPYLAYMRQDMAFTPGEAISQRVLGDLLSKYVDGVVTFDAHLHRVHSLAEVFPKITAVNLSAAPLLAQAISAEGRATIIGPDSESAQWVGTIAALTGFPFLIGEKVRQGDRSVSIQIPGIESVRGGKVVLVDDMVSSGATLIEAASLALAAGAARVDALVTHCLAGEADLVRMRSAGIRSLGSTDTIPGATSGIAIAGLIAEAVRELGPH